MEEEVRFLLTIANLKRPLVFLRNNVFLFLIIFHGRSCLRGGSTESWGDLAVKEETKSFCQERDLFSGFLAFLVFGLLLLFFVVIVVVCCVILMNGSVSTFFCFLFVVVHIFACLLDG